MIKIYFSFIAFLLTLSSTAQDYQPFSENSSKRFFVSGDPSNNDYFFHATSSNISGDTTILSNYYTIFDFGISGNHPECPFWGGANGEYLDTTWLGTHVELNSVTSELMIFNINNEPLNFDFSTAIGASEIFYSDGVTNYFIEHTATNFENFLGVSDSVKIFTINAFDTGGNPVSSVLNNFEIKLSKNYGLLSFINCFDFPSVQQGYELQGQTNPLIGSYQLTYDDAYPWQVGDVLQYFSNNTVPGGFTKQAYHTLTVTDRTETADSVFITYDALIQETNTIVPSSFVFYMNYDPIRYKKGDPIWELPWNGAITLSQMAESGIRGAEDTLTECSTKPQFATLGSFNMYCDSCKCYGGYDAFGSSFMDRYYAKDVGIYRQMRTDAGPLIGLNFAQLEYWNVNGEECGTFWNNLDEIPQFNLSVSPNPTKDKLEINSERIIDEIRILDLSGRLIFNLDNIHQKSTEISLASLKKGAYILEVRMNDSIQTQTIIRE